MRGIRGHQTRPTERPLAEGKHPEARLTRRRVNAPEPESHVLGSPSKCRVVPRGQALRRSGQSDGPSHAAKGGRRWRYYVSRALLKGRQADAGSVTRVSAEQLEKQVFDATKSVIASRRSIVGLGALSHVGVSGRTVGSHPTEVEPCQSSPFMRRCSPRSSE